MRGDIQDGITRDDYETAISKSRMGQCTVEIVHTSITPQGVSVTFEYIFERRGLEEDWALKDVVVIIKGVAACS